MESVYWLFLLIPLTAILYSSIGHGGASGYLALFSLFAYDITELKTLALTLNLVAAGISFYWFKKYKHFKFSLFWPLAITSVPFSFLGATVSIDSFWYTKLLGAFLIFATLKFWIAPKDKPIKTGSVNILLALFIGAGLGFFSGIIGIGGGIILSPLILLLGWADAKTTAGISALFIWVNSLAGLLGYGFTQGSLYNHNSMLGDIYIIICFIILIVLASTLGAYVGSAKLKSAQVKYLLSIVLALASFKLLFF